MFDYSKMIKRAIEFFPQWSDIRKRHQTSVGGRLMSSILDESVKIEEAIFLNEAYSTEGKKPEATTSNGSSTDSGDATSAEGDVQTSEEQ